MKLAGSRLRDYLGLEVPWRWAAWWLLLPNLLFLAMWPIGGPTMSPAILVSGIVAVVAVQMTSAPARVLTLATIFVMQAAVYVTRSFNIHFANVFAIHQHIPELDPAQSPEYILAGLVFAGLLTIGAAFGKAVQPFASRTQMLRGLALVALLALADNFATSSTQGSYRAMAPAGAPVDSALLQNDVTPAGISADNLIVVMVESWGVPSRPYERSLDQAVWNTDGLAGQYDVSRGTNLYYGSTTNGEMRELCGVWADHISAEFDRLGCLPQSFADQGYRTIAYHGFDGAFFNRRDWYARIGFARQKFAPDLRKEGARSCGGVFPGVCDIDIPRIMAHDLRTSPSRRNFVYWLTLNAHLPVSPDVVYGTARCSLGEPAWGKQFPMLCRSFMVHKAVADALFKEIADPAFPEADVLIVGDHMPPFFPREIRSRFDPTRVPYIYLRNRAAAARAEKLTATGTDRLQRPDEARP